MSDKFTNSLGGTAVPKFLVDVEESYSQAGQWQELIKDIPNGEADKILAQNFRQQFKTKESTS